MFIMSKSGLKYAHLWPKSKQGQEFTEAKMTMLNVNCEHA